MKKVFSLIILAEACTVITFFLTLACIIFAVVFVVHGLELEYIPVLVYNDGVRVYIDERFVDARTISIYGGVTVALVDSNLWAGTMTFRDKDGNKSSTTVYEDGGLLYAAASASFASKAGLMGALSDAELVSITITRQFNDPDLLTNSAGASSDVERKGAFVFVDSQYKPVTVNIPSLKYGLTQEGTNKINRLDAASAAFILAMTASGRTYRNLDIIRIIDAEKRHRNSSEG